MDNGEERARHGNVERWDLFRMDSRWYSWIWVSVLIKSLYSELKSLRWSEELLQYHIHSSHHLGEQEIVAGLVHHSFTFIKSFWLR